MLVQDRMTKNICSCRVDTNLVEAARQLWDSDCGSLPVVDGRGRVLGMITDRDICMAGMTTGKPLGALWAGAAMAKDVVTTRPTESVHEAEMRMRARSVRRLPVIDDQDRLVGMLSCNDLVQWVDAGKAAGATERDSSHLLRTLATIGRTRDAKVAQGAPQAAVEGTLPGKYADLPRTPAAIPVLHEVRPGSLSS